MDAELALIPILEPVQAQMGRVREILDETAQRWRTLVPGEAEPLGSMLCRTLHGGKRLRAALVLLMGEVFGVSGPPFVRLGAAIEILHAATLIHDDLIDCSPLRRGHETLHTVWPAAAAVLAGDYLLGEAIGLAAGLGEPRLLEVFAGALRTMCADEVARLLAPQVDRASRSAYYHSVEAKTCALFCAMLEAVGILARAEAHLDTLRQVGRNLGLAFQIVDDVLDLVGDEGATGKPVGGDLVRGCVTLPILYYLEQGIADTPVHAVLGGERSTARVGEALAALRASGAIESALAEARYYAGQCRDLLAQLPDNSARQALCALCTYAVERER